MKSKVDMQKIIRAYNRKHSKGTQIHVPCTYWECRYRRPKFGVQSSPGVWTETIEYCCHAEAPNSPVSMSIWIGDNAPDWCPKRITHKQQKVV